MFRRSVYLSHAPSLWHLAGFLDRTEDPRCVPVSNFPARFPLPVGRDRHTSFCRTLRNAIRFFTFRDRGSCHKTVPRGKTPMCRRESCWQAAGKTNWKVIRFFLCFTHLPKFPACNSQLVRAAHALPASSASLPLSAAAASPFHHFRYASVFTWKFATTRTQKLSLVLSVLRGVGKRGEKAAEEWGGVLVIMTHQLRDFSCDRCFSPFLLICFLNCASSWQAVNTCAIRWISNGIPMSWCLFFPALSLSALSSTYNVFCIYCTTTKPSPCAVTVRRCSCFCFRFCCCSQRAMHTPTIPAAGRTREWVSEWERPTVYERACVCVAFVFCILPFHGQPLCCCCWEFLFCYGCIRLVAFQWAWAPIQQPNERATERANDMLWESVAFPVQLTTPSAFAGRQFEPRSARRRTLSVPTLS